MGEEVTGVTRSELDITDRIAVLTAVQEHGPQVVVNCAAWTAVDDAEAREKEALQVNGMAPDMSPRHAQAAARGWSMYRRIMFSAAMVPGRIAKTTVRLPGPPTGGQN